MWKLSISIASNYFHSSGLFLFNIMNITGEKITKYGIEFEVAECYNPDVEIIYPEKNLYFNTNVVCKKLVSNKVFFDFGKSLKVGERIIANRYFIQSYCKWSISISNNLNIKIGCKEKTVQQWDEWFKSSEEYETERETEEFELIRLSFNSAKTFIPIIDFYQKRGSNNK